jgi:hypothetical protein
MSQVKGVKNEVKVAGSATKPGRYGPDPKFLSHICLLNLPQESV